MNNKQISYPIICQSVVLNITVLFVSLNTAIIVHAKYYRNFNGMKNFKKELISCMEESVWEKVPLIDSALAPKVKHGTSNEDVFKEYLSTSNVITRNSLFNILDSRYLRDDLNALYYREKCRIVKENNLCLKDM